MHIKQKKYSNSDRGWKDNKVVYIASSKSSEPKKFVWRLNKVERTTTNVSPLLQPDHGFCRQMDQNSAKYSLGM